MIDYTSFDSKTKVAFDCALKMFSRIEKEGTYIEISTLSDGIWDCFVIFGIRYMFKHMKDTSQYKELVDLLQENRNYDIILGKFLIYCLRMLLRILYRHYRKILYRLLMEPKKKIESKADIIWTIIIFSAIASGGLWYNIFMLNGCFLSSCGGSVN